MPEKIARLSANGNAPTVEITIGDAHWGSYRLDLYDHDGLNPVEVGTGLNVDQIPDVFNVPANAVTTLNGRLLSWDANVVAFGSGSDQPYSVIVDITQNGQKVPGGSIQISGHMDGAKVVHDFVRFVVA
jgi:hypothetical protein